MKKWILSLSVLCLFSACEQRRSQSNYEPGDASDALADDDKGEKKKKNSPEEVQAMVNEALDAKAPGVTDTKIARGVAETGKAANMFRAQGGKAGYFLVAGSSITNIRGGDMIRRIDLAPKITEFDYDNEKEGKQGAFVYIPENIQANFPTRSLNAEGFFTGTMCGFIPVSDNELIVLADTVAFVIDPREKAAAFTAKKAFVFPNASRVCRGVYVPKNKKLYTVDIAFTGDTGSMSGVYIADLNADEGVAKLYKTPSGYGINTPSVNNFQDIDIHDSEIFLLTGNARFDAAWDTAVHRIPLNESGEPIFAQAKFHRCNNPIERLEGCAIGAPNIASMMVHQGKDGATLLTGGSLGVVAWKIEKDTLTKIDTQPQRPGTQNINFTENGRGAVGMAYSPDMKKLFVLPHCRSEKKQKYHNGNEVFVHAISEYSADNISSAPKAVDMTSFEFMNGIVGKVRHMPITSATMRAFAVGSKHIAVIGAASAGLSGLSALGDMIIIDRAKNQPITFNTVKNPKMAHQQNYGFRLADGDPTFASSSQTLHAVIWIP